MKTSIIVTFSTLKALDSKLFNKRFQKVTKNSIVYGIVYRVKFVNYSKNYIKKEKNSLVYLRIYSNHFDFIPNSLCKFIGSRHMKRRLSESYREIYEKLN